jgi:hypothetical protein
MSRFILAIFFVLAQVSTLPSGPQALERLRAKVSVESVTGASIERLAGHYKNTSKELRERVGGFLFGDDLYLFPDGTYIYCEWSDISPVTISDKGTWSLGENSVELKSGPEITWDPGAYRQYDRKYAVIRRSSQPKEVLLVGVEYKLSNFEQSAGDDPGFMLLVVSMKRESTIDGKQATALKAKLMKSAWRPEYYQKAVR